MYFCFLLEIPYKPVQICTGEQLNLPYQTYVNKIFFELSWNKTQWNFYSSGNKIHMFWEFFKRYLHKTSKKCSARLTR